MKYEIIRTDTADAGIRKIILYVAQIQLHLRSLIRLRNEFLIWEMIRILEQIQDIWFLRGRDIKSLF